MVQPQRVVPVGWLTGLLRLLRAFQDGTFVPKSTASNPLIRGFSPRHAILLRKMGWLTGFEPATLGTTSRCSNQLSYSHHLEKYACRTTLMKSRYALPVCTLVNSALKEILPFLEAVLGLLLICHSAHSALRGKPLTATHAHH